MKNDYFPVAKLTFKIQLCVVLEYVINYNSSTVVQNTFKSYWSYIKCTLLAYLFGKTSILIIVVSHKS